MITEGIGRHAPSPIRELLTQQEMRLVANAAIRIANKRKEYRTSNSRWKRGLIGELNIPGIGAIPSHAAPMFVGLQAEAAVVLFLNRRARLSLSLQDLLLSSGDDGTDINVSGLTVQVKARQCETMHSLQKVSLVRYATERGRIVFPLSVVVAMCEVVVPTPLVKLLGWIYSSDARAMPIVPARKGGHTNIEIADCELQSMASLVERITAAKELAR